MDREGKLSGKRRDYPIEVYKGRECFNINNDDELLDLITETYLELKELSKDGKVEIKQAFNKLSIWEGEDIQPMQIVDRRTSDILKTYSFYKHSPEKAFEPIPQIWFDSYIILNKLEPRMF